MIKPGSNSYTFVQGFIPVEQVPHIKYVRVHTRSNIWCFVGVLDGVSLIITKCCQLYCIMVTHWKRVTVNDHGIRKVSCLTFESFSRGNAQTCLVLLDIQRASSACKHSYLLCRAFKADLMQNDVQYWPQNTLSSPSNLRVHKALICSSLLVFIVGGRLLCSCTRE